MANHYYEREALVFGCTKCGACCSRPGVVYLTMLDVQRLAEFLEATEAQVKEAFLVPAEQGWWIIPVEEGHPCPFFTSEGTCTIHPVKPVQCRTYPFWEELVTDARAWEAEAAFCPGIGQGRAYGVAEVKKLLQGWQGTD